MRRARIFWISSLLACLGLAAATPAITSAAGPFTCAGSFTSPGVLSGSYSSGVVVKGVCEVSAGHATVTGNVQVDAGGVLAAAFGQDFRTHSAGSGLTVKGSILALSGSAVILGCNPKQFVCLDDHGAKATLSSHELVTGGIQADSSLAVLVYGSSVGGDVVQRGGGGGYRCGQTGVFARFRTAVYSAYVSDRIGGQLHINHVASCFMQVSHVHVGGGVSLVSNRLANPDAIEVTYNTIRGDLVCYRNSHVWDSEGYHQNKAYPRAYEPNKVGKARLGQCAKATPTSKGQPAPSAPF